MNDFRRVCVKTLSMELLEFFMSHNRPWRSRTRISSGHLKNVCASFSSWDVVQ